MTDQQTRPESGVLTLGWQVTPTLTPRYWLDPAAKVGEQSDQDLVQVPAGSMASHTAIVAQSGSGKSFFLGRLIEEITLRTKARCVILDPNADFRRISEVVEDTRWTSAAYDHRKALGFLPHESSCDEFASPWSAIKKNIRGGPQITGKTGEQLRLLWPSLSIDFLAEDVEPMIRSDLYHCHEFVKSVANLLEMKHTPPPRRQSANAAERTSDDEAQGIDLIEESRRILQRIRIGDAQYKRNLIEQEFNVDALLREHRGTLRFSLWPFIDLETVREVREGFIRREIDRAVAAGGYISDNAERYYFGKAQEYAAQGIVETRVAARPARSSVEARIDVIDLPSFPDPKTRFLALNSVLSTEWERARMAWAKAIENSIDEDERVPTFIVVDEAHNLVPFETQGRAAESLREQFRTIAAEGRKYGLFLILCTQRPDKIDPLILSECENQAIMRLGSRSVLGITKKLLGFDDVPLAILNKCLEFEKGRTLLIGRWAKAGPQLFYCAMRRTVEGGRDLREQHWACPEQSRSAEADSSKASEPKERPKKTVTSRGTAKESRSKQEKVG